MLRLNLAQTSACADCNFTVISIANISHITINLSMESFDHDQNLNGNNHINDTSTFECRWTNTKNLPDFIDYILNHNHCCKIRTFYFSNLRSMQRIYRNVMIDSWQLSSKRDMRRRRWLMISTKDYNTLNKAYGLVLGTMSNHFVLRANEYSMSLLWAVLSDYTYLVLLKCS